MGATTSRGGLKLVGVGELGVGQVRQGEDSCKHTRRVSSEMGGCMPCLSQAPESDIPSVAASHSLCGQVCEMHECMDDVD